MARTRTQTGVIKDKKYDYPTLRVKGEKTLSSDKPEKKIRKGGKPNKKNPKKTPNKGTGKGKEKETSSNRSLSPLSDFNHEPTPQPEAGGRDTSDGNHFWPSVVLGAKEQKGLSAIERADQLVTKWEKILEEHEKNFPEAVPEVKVQLAVARTERDAWKNDETKNRIINEDKREQAVQERIKALLGGLENSQNECEKENINGAIEGYRSGRIGYSKHYTIIWGGKVVDVADTYAEFAIGRKERLDRYAKKHGPHWLWFESPLWVHPESRTRAMRCAVVERVASQNDFGLYYINQGFWKRSGNVTRMPQTDYGAGMQPVPDTVPNDPNTNYGFNSGPGVPVNCGGVGAKLTFRSLLDSGATYPSLYASDFRSLGVYPPFYPAQSLVNVLTANGPVTQRIYEMHVEVNDEGGQSLVDSVDPVNPAFERYIGGLSPVIMLSAEDSPPVDENGMEENLRLSGIMPFLASYISTTPTKNIMLFGENRNDVLGAHKIPPARRWMVGLSQDASDRSYWNNFQDPQITFSHRRGLILDQDIGPAISKMTVNVGMGDLERSETFDPRGDFQRRLAAGQQGGVVDPSVLDP